MLRQIERSENIKKENNLKNYMLDCQFLFLYIINWQSFL